MQFCRFSQLLYRTQSRGCYFAAAGLAAIAYSTFPKLASVKPGDTDFRSSQAIRTLLRDAIRDPDVSTRRNALTAYLLAFPVQADLQDELADRFDVERTNPLLQQTILTALTMDGSPNAKANLILERLLSTPETSWEVAQAISASATPPKVILSKPVSSWQVSKEASKSAELIRAIPDMEQRRSHIYNNSEKRKTGKRTSC